MKKTTFIRLIDSYLQGSATLQERNIVEAYYQKMEEKGKTDLGAEREAALQQQMLQHILAEIEQERKPVVKLWPRIAVIAAAVTSMALCIYFVTAPKGGRHLEGSVATRDLLNDVAPGRSGATITLGNGQVIALSGAKKGVVIGGNNIMYSDKTPLSPQGASLPQGEREARLLIASTAKGQTYEFTLPDGSHVWLNADSKISFPGQFKGRERRIQLEGEAYFSVVHNAKQPFRVESKGQMVEDIGTEFNISAYADERMIKTTLVEGSAKVNDVTLKPDQQSVLANGALKIQTVDAENTAAWKDGVFIFEDEPLSTILNKVARWYDVEVVYTAGVDQHKRYGGSVSRYDKVSSVLEVLESTKNIHFKIEGRRLLVMK